MEFPRISRIRYVCSECDTEYIFPVTAKEHLSALAKVRFKCQLCGAEESYNDITEAVELALKYNSLMDEISKFVDDTDNGVLIFEE